MTSVRQYFPFCKQYPFGKFISFRSEYYQIFKGKGKKLFGIIGADGGALKRFLTGFGAGWRGLVGGVGRGDEVNSNGGVRWLRCGLLRVVR